MAMNRGPVVPVQCYYPMLMIMAYWACGAHARARAQQARCRKKPKLTILKRARRNLPRMANEADEGPEVSMAVSRVAVDMPWSPLYCPPSPEERASEERFKRSCTRGILDFLPWSSLPRQLFSFYMFCGLSSFGLGLKLVESLMR